MSRSGYDYDLDNLEYGRWRASVSNSIRGKRGQSFLRELLAVLDALPSKRLIAGEIVANGECCTLGAIAMKRGVDLSEVQVDDPDSVGDALDIASPLAAEIAYENDEGGLFAQTPEQRFNRMRQWVNEHIRKGDV